MLSYITAECAAPGCEGERPARRPGAMNVTIRVSTANEYLRLCVAVDGIRQKEISNVMGFAVTYVSLLLSGSRPLAASHVEAFGRAIPSVDPVVLLALVEAQKAQKPEILFVSGVVS